MLASGLDRVNFAIDSNEHHAYGSTREMLTFALKEICLLLLCVTEDITATRAHVGLFLFTMRNILQGNSKPLLYD